MRLGGLSVICIIILFTFIIVIVASPVQAAQAGNDSVYYAQGRDEYNASDYSAALADFNNAIQLNATDENAWLYKGDTLYYIGKDSISVNAFGQAISDPDKNNYYNAALAAFNQAIALDPNDHRAYVGKGVVLDSLFQTNDAIAAYNQAIALDPNDSTAYCDKGRALEELGQFNRALAAYNQAITLDPNRTHGYDGKGSVLSAMGQYNQALAAYNQALQLDPNDTDAQMYVPGVKYEMQKSSITPTSPILVIIGMAIACIVYRRKW